MKSVYYFIFQTSPDCWKQTSVDLTNCWKNDPTSSIRWRIVTETRCWWRVPVTEANTSFLSYRREVTTCQLLMTMVLMFCILLFRKMTNSHLSCWTHLKWLNSQVKLSIARTTDSSIHLYISRRCITTTKQLFGCCSTEPIHLSKITKEYVLLNNMVVMNTRKHGFNLFANKVGGTFSFLFSLRFFWFFDIIMLTNNSSLTDHLKNNI